MTYDERIYNAALADGMPAALSMLIVAQARHETGGYTSNVFTRCNNAFGYKYVGQRLSTGPCTSSPELDNYAGYSSIENSTHEITGWIKRRQNEGVFPSNLNEITTAEQYAQLLKAAGYYGDTFTNYANGLVYWLSQIADIVKPATGAALLVILALGLIAYHKKIFGK